MSPAEISPTSLSVLAEQLGLPAGAAVPWGRNVAKVELEAPSGPLPGKLVLVTAMNPTPSGEGKTTVALGLSMALSRAGVRAVPVLRQPSLGPLFGVKGGGAGGGKAHLVPFNDVNLHLTGDFHAVSAAHNLLAALLDAHLFHGNALGADVRDLTWPRVLDVNERSLRELVIGLGGKSGGIPRQTRFDITAASEVMAILALSRDVPDLKARLGRIVVGSTSGASPKPVSAAELGAAGSMAVLLKDALLPNLVQTAEGSPALVHAGPFGNIAHGSPSVRAMRLSASLDAVSVVEAGFGADLGAQKFLDLACPASGLWPALAIVVGTVRAAKHHGGVAKDRLALEDPAAVRRGLVNLVHHLEAMSRRGFPVLAALNLRAGDPAADVEAFLAGCKEAGFDAVQADPYGAGGPGCVELGERVQALLGSQTSRPAPVHPYDGDAPFRAKLDGVVRESSGGLGASLSAGAAKALARFESWGFGNLPPCIARTQYSLSDDPTALGRPTGFTVAVRELRLLAGAGFLVPVSGEIMTMPGLPARPAAFDIDLDDAGKPIGVR